MAQVYNIDVPVYHYDNDHYEEELKTLAFSSLDEAFKAQSYLRWLPYRSEWSFTNRLSFGFHSKELEEIDWPIMRLGVWMGGIFQSNFDVYTTRITRTIWRNQ